MKKTASFLLLALGIILMGYNPFMDYYYIPKHLSQQNQVLKDLSADKILENLNENKDDLESFDFSEVSSITSKDIMNTKVNKDKIIGMIYIPSVGIRMPIMYGATHQNMLVGAGTLKPNQKMGEGNYSISSHNHPNKNMLFAPIRRIDENDKMYVTDFNEVYVYNMKEKEVIEPTRVDVIEDSSEDPKLTLISCYSSDGSDRIYVSGDLYEVVDYKEMPESFRMAIEKGE